MIAQSNIKSGYLEVFIGPMYSGKTSKLLEIHKQCNYCNISVAVINHSADNRYHETMLASHDNIMIKCIQTPSLTDIWNYSNLEDNLNIQAENHIMLRNANVILINEAQFFDDLYEVVVSMLDSKKIIYVCGLDGDFKQQKFGQILDIIPLCDNITKFKSLCAICKDGTPGIFSLRLSKETDQMVIGSDNYLPVCRNCFNNV